MNSGAIGGMAGGLAVTVVFALLRRFRPLTTVEPLDPPLTEEERASYRRWEVSALVPFFVFVPILTGLWFLVFRAVANGFDPSTPTTRFLIRPATLFWMLPAFFAGIVSAAGPMALLYRTLLGDRYARYTRACDERVGSDGWAFFRVLAIVVGLAVAAAVVLGVRTYARFDEDAITVVRPFSSGAERHPYSDVAAIEYHRTFVAPNGNTVQRPHHIIRFADGSSWSTREALRDPEPALDAQIIDFVADRSGQPIVDLP